MHSRRQESQEFVSHRFHHHLPTDLKYLGKSETLGQTKVKDKHELSSCFPSIKAAYSDIAQSRAVSAICYLGDVRIIAIERE
jgi:hypothetical protein